MFVTSAEQRGGLLVAVITGGRPQLAQRPTRKFLPALKETGVADVVWVVSENDAPTYEMDDNSLSVYPTGWAEEYAATHWLQPEPYKPGGFFGAFVGREWACLEAEKRGCWGVLQLDDNIQYLTFARNSGGGLKTMQDLGGIKYILDILAGITLSTNGRMVGPQLTSVSGVCQRISRTGFPYSCFIEKVGPGREHWFGPFEDDITHAMQYGTRADNTTALVVPLLNYCKESKSKTGMRTKYNNVRAVQLQRTFPESAAISAQSTKSNGVKGNGTARVFHRMSAGAIRNPQVIHDRELYGEIKLSITNAYRKFCEAHIECNREKMRKRAGLDG